MRKVLLAGAIFIVLCQGASAQESQVTSTAAASFIATAESGNLISQIIGIDVYNNNGQAVGRIEDVAMSKDGQIQALILSLAEYFGLTERYVAVKPSAVTIGFSESDNSWHARMNASAEQLKAAPEYQYAGGIVKKACLNILR
jgi:sporulation protein YlmC with PRC-barrel domain